MVLINCVKVEPVLHVLQAKPSPTQSVTVSHPHPYCRSTLCCHLKSSTEVCVFLAGRPSGKPWLAVFKQWQPNDCHGKMVRDGCIFGIGDLPSLVQRREFFVSTLRADFEPLALQCLSAWIRQKEACPPVFDFNYYSSLPFVKNNRRPFS